MHNQKSHLLQDALNSCVECGIEAESHAVATEQRHGHHFDDGIGGSIRTGQNGHHTERIRQLEGQRVLGGCLDPALATVLLDKADELQNGGSIRSGIG